MTQRGNSRGKWKEGQEGLSGLSGRLESMGSGQRLSKEAISDGRLPGSFPLKKIVLMEVRQGG
jgi:hypothetical protein